MKADQKFFKSLNKSQRKWLFYNWPRSYSSGQETVNCMEVLMQLADWNDFFQCCSLYLFRDEAFRGGAYFSEEKLKELLQKMKSAARTATHYREVAKEEEDFNDRKRKGILGCL